MKKKAYPNPANGNRTAVSVLPAEDNDPTGSYGNTASCLRAIIDSLQDELLVVDRQYRVIEANTALLSRHGKVRAEVIGRNCDEITDDVSGPCLVPLDECSLQTVWETGKPAHLTRERVNRSEDGEETRFVDIVASPIISGDGTITGVAVLMRDITDTKELELGIVKAKETLSALTTIASVVTESLDLDTVLSRALETTLEIMQCSTGGIMLLDDEGQTLSYCVHRGLSDRYAREMRHQLGEGISGRVAQTGESILVEDISKDPRASRRDLIVLEEIRPFVSVPLLSKERVLGVLNVTSHEAGKLSPASVQLLESIAAQIAIAIENARLHKEVQRKEEIRGELLQDIFTVQEEERKRIARELHDETSQVLASLTGNLEAAASMLPDNEQKTRAILRKAQSLSIELLDGTNRLIYELRPTLLDDMGLIAATRWLITNNLEAAGVKVTFNTVGTVRRLDPQVETTLFRVIQEAVNNIARHAEAKKATIRLQFKKNFVLAQVKDNGTGFDVEEAISSKERPRGLGLLGMRERMELMKGTLNIASKPGGGTEVNIEIPVKQEVINE